MKWRPSLRSVLLLINLVIVLLPLAGIAWLRLYESALVRQTESELLAQGAVVAAAYEAAWMRETMAVPADAKPVLVPGSDWRPRPPRLDLARDPVLPRAADPAFTLLRADAQSVAVGADFSALLREAQRVTLASIRVVDAQGIIVASTAADFGGLLATQEEVARSLLGETVSLLRERHSDSPAPGAGSISRSSGIRVFVALPVVRDGRVLGAVLLARTPANIWQTIQGKRLPLLYAGLMLLAVVLTLSWLTTRLIATPIRELRARSQRAARGESGALQPLRHAGTREVAALSQTLTEMAQTLEARADYIRSFAAHVSHEFKTPLTSIRGAVELLREHADTLAPAERSRFQDMIAADTSRLDVLVRRLLELARADVSRPGTERCDASVVLREDIDRARTLGCDIEFEALQPSASVRAPAEDLHSIFGNLLDNARLHARGATIRVHAAIVGAELQVRVEDQGPGISQTNAARIFQPFFTTARAAGSTGLGLPIVQALLTAHGGAISLLPAPTGACFLVRLPVSLDEPSNQ